MSRINKLTGLLFMVMLLNTNQGCDNRQDYFDQLNTFPEVEIQGDYSHDDIWIDTIKIGLEKDYYYEIKGVELLEHDYTGDGLVINIDKTHFKITGQSKGRYEINFKAVNPYDQVFTKLFQFEVIENLLPETIIELKQTKALSENEIEIDATTSFDKDARFGGEIVTYEYKIANYTFESPFAKVRYICGTKGAKQIRVRVMDNDRKWSEYVTKAITVE